MKILYRIWGRISFNFLSWAIFLSIGWLLALPGSIQSQTVDTVFFENWESGIGSWYVDQGVWEVGIPTAGPTAAYSGQNCAGTILAGNYPDNSDTRLISPQIVLPSLSIGEKLQLKIWQWFQFCNNIAPGLDKGILQIKVGTGDWENIAGPFWGLSPCWTQINIDISAYAGQNIRIGFHFISDFYWTDTGWYIDDILINKGVVTFTNPEDFEKGVGEWNTENGLWEVGIPTIGPSAVHSGQNCAGTILGKDYTYYDSTRLISSEIIIDSLVGFIPELFFWHWYRISDGDTGYVQIKTSFADWVNLAGPYCGISPVWSQGYADLSAYEGDTVQIAFYFTSDGNSFTVDNGWYIDDIRITVYNFPPIVIKNIPDTSFAEDTGPLTVVSDLDSNFSDPDGSLTYTSFSDNSNIQATIQNKSLRVNSSQDYFGSGNVRITATDDGGKSVSDTFSVVVDPVNDPPEINLPDSITFRNDSYVVIQLWEYANDVETVDSLLEFECSTDTSALFIDYNPQTDVVTLSASDYLGSCHLYVTVIDDSNASASDTMGIRVESVTGLIDVTSILPIKYELFQNYPNPFNPATTITYQIPEITNVSLKVYDVLGREVATLVNEEKLTGNYEVEFNAIKLTSGIYFYQIKTDKFIETKKMQLLR